MVIKEQDNLIDIFSDMERSKQRATRFSASSIQLTKLLSLISIF